jgi:pimeloyl-ACP methyl ester carboxylesterase
VGESLLVRLGDGRLLSYAEYGQPTGCPLVYLHGFPGSRLGGAVLDDVARAAGVRVLAPERPGLGLSSPQPARTLLDTARDLRTFGEALQLGRFSVLGESGGGPHALACAHELPDLLNQVVVVGGLGPATSLAATVGIAFKERIGYAIGSRLPLLSARTLVPVAACARRWPRQFLHVTRWQLGNADREILQGPLGDLTAADFAEAFHQGCRGVADDLALLFRPWPFDPSTINVPVSFHHGTDDRTVSLTATRELAQTIPSSQLHVYENDGHFSLLARHAQEILEHAIAAAPRRPREHPPPES